MTLDSKLLVAGFGLVACCGQAIAECPRGEWPCAVVEIDHRGGLWVDGRRGTIDDVVGRCTKSSSDAAVIVPDSDAPIVDVAHVWNELKDRGVHVHHLTPCDRVELRELFGLDPMEMCSAVSDRSFVALGESVARCRPEPESPIGSEERPSLDVAVNASTPFGKTDVAARRHGLQWGHGVAIIIPDYHRRPALTLSSEHSFVAPPPTLGHERDGRSCFYPKLALKPDG